MRSPPPLPAALLAWGGRVLPWAVAGGLLWYLLRKVSLEKTLAAVEGADLSLLLPAAVLCILAWFLLDSAALSYIFTRFNAPFSRREARSIRALTYLLAVVNWNLGTGGIVLHMRHAKGVPVIEAASTIFFYNLIDGLILTSLVLGGVLFLPRSLGLQSLGVAAAVLVAAQVATLVFFLSRRRPSWRWLRRLADMRVFRTHQRATPRDTLVVLAFRVAYFAMFVVFFAIALPAFGASVPIAHLAATVPAILAVGTLPITPAGLGTQQAAVVYFYRDYAGEPALLAFGFLLTFVFVLMRAPLSLFYLGDLARLRAEISAGGDAGTEPVRKQRP